MKTDQWSLTPCNSTSEAPQSIHDTHPPQIQRPVTPIWESLKYYAKHKRDQVRPSVHQEKRNHNDNNLDMDSHVFPNPLFMFWLRASQHSK